MFGLSPAELMLVGVVAVLLFGANLPKVARSLGQSMAQFRKGMQELKEEFQAAAADQPSRPARRAVRYHDIDDREEATVPKFEPPPAEPRPVDQGQSLV